MTTIKLSMWATLFATIIGTVMALFRNSRSLFRRMVGRTYVELVRNMPPLVLVFIVYYFISDQVIRAIGLEGLLRSLSPGVQGFLAHCCAPVPKLPVFAAAVVMLALYEGAYITEIVRAGIQSIERGQWEASSALGFTRFQQLRHVIFPQAVVRILPRLPVRSSPPSRTPPSSRSYPSRNSPSRAWRSCPRHTGPSRYGSP